MSKDAYEVYYVTVLLEAFGISYFQDFNCGRIIMFLISYIQL